MANSTHRESRASSSGNRVTLGYPPTPGRFRPAIRPGPPFRIARRSTGTVGNSGGVESVIPVGPGPSFPRVPRGITQPPEPFGVPGGLGIEPLPLLPSPNHLLTGRLGIASIEDLESALPADSRSTRPSNASCA